MEVEVGLNISRAFLEEIKVGFGLVNSTLGSPGEDGGGAWLGQPNGSR